ncbi:MAG TPA: hypothetical protein VGM90_25315 [Kofleriaceae bacterium]|jgi:hypothetical protein
MRTVGLVIALAVVGCGGGGGKAQDAGDDTPADVARGGDAGPDAAPDAAPTATGCTALATPSSTFTNTICGPWGAASGAAMVENDMMQTLRITPSGTSTSDGTCTSNATTIISDGGYFMEVPTPILATAGYTTLRHTALDVAINSRDNKLRLTNAIGTVTIAQVPFVMGAMRWWRLRPDRTTNEIIGEYSADANAWYELGRVARTLNMSGFLVVAAGSESPTASVGFADIDNLNVCP